VRAGTILIVDEEPEGFRLFLRILTSSGRDSRVLRARDGLEALNVLRRQRPDAILLDLVMPNMDGFRLLEVKSQDPALSDIPVIAVSARDPAGQPIVSKSLAITRDTGLTAYQLLAYVRTIGTIFSTGERSAGLTPPAIPPD